MVDMDNEKKGVEEDGVRAVKALGGQSGGIEELLREVETCLDVVLQERRTRMARMW